MYIFWTSTQFSNNQQNCWRKTFPFLLNEYFYLLIISNPYHTTFHQSPSRRQQCFFLKISQIRGISPNRQPTFITNNTQTRVLWIAYWEYSQKHLQQDKCCILLLRCLTLLYSPWRCFSVTVLFTHAHSHSHIKVNFAAFQSANL